MKRRYALVVMAASAGGVQALQKVLSGLPPDFPLPIAIVQHRTAGAVSAILPLGEIAGELERLARLPAQTVQPVPKEMPCKSPLTS